jgi:hypothetical protein
MGISLTDEERQLLARLLDGALRELRVEVRHTDDAELKDELRHRENLLRSIIAKASEPAAVGH